MENKTTKENKKNILVLGVGNILMADEGIGVHVIKEMESLDLPENVELLDGGTAALDLIPYLKGRNKLIIVDCIDTQDPPGTIYRLSPEDLENIKTFTISSMHQIGLAETIKLSKLLGNNSDIVIIGVAPKNYNQYRIEISPELNKVVPKIIDIIFKEMKDIN
ncbi:MAG: hydrogenase maturation protease [Candidatus Syntrophonatronum acetioxidans]|uniref:Hydrogenase maturation protease n=1 Tax=Candidatus Syntrophonatronum acetioxidans TaxID=1795816 RepID=A0A424YDN2_9FIRM|nr:MAG: hydrogenase maturation protease [Candidatus Syntrophonatronum acetioxidans]